MRAVWYDRQGPAGEVLLAGELAAGEAGPGEVRVRLTVSGVNPGDTKKRRGWLGSEMPYPRVIPHSDGAGVIESAGEGVEPSRVGQRVWVYGAQSYRPFGTAAQMTVVPDDQAVALPGTVSDEVGACLGIPGITAHRAVFGDGSVRGTTLLIHGVLGAVGSLAAQLASWGGASVIGTVRRADDLRLVRAGVDHAVALEDSDAAGAIRAHASDGVHRIVEVAFSDNVDLDAAVATNQTVIAAYASRGDRPDFPLLADAVRQRHHPSPRQRRLPGGGQAAGGGRSDGGSPRWRTLDPRRRRPAARGRSRRSRQGRRRHARPRPAQDPELSRSASPSAAFPARQRIPRGRGLAASDRNVLNMTLR